MMPGIFDTNRAYAQSESPRGQHCGLGQNMMSPIALFYLLQMFITFCLTCLKKNLFDNRM